MAETRSSRPRRRRGRYAPGAVHAAWRADVLKSSDQTAVATLDIENMVRHMQEAVTTGVMQMDSFSDDVRSGVARVTEINGQTGRIIEEVHGLSDRYHHLDGPFGPFGDQVFCLLDSLAVLQRNHADRWPRTIEVGILQRFAVVIVALGFLTAGLAVQSQTDTAVAKSRALIVVGLPGDAEHEKLFATIAGHWRDGLTESLGFDVTVLFGRSKPPKWAKDVATKAVIECEVANLQKSLGAEDRLWVFFLGHGDYDGERARFHLPGSDLHANALGKLFAGIKCQEQVFWMTHSASGWFLKPLSAKGRIVITATAADQEYNETEFPQALATVTGKLKAKNEAKLSVLELYRRTVAEVEARFAADKRVPTEHAQLDDNGDGVGTEEPIVEKVGDQKPTADGALAARTFLPRRKAKK
jgi:hypothetical protein